MASASRSNKRLLFGFALVVVLAAAGAATYLYKDSRAKETPTKGAGKPPASVPVMVAAVNQQTLPVRVLAIGNVEPYTTVAVKARIDGQILEVNFQEGKEVKKGEVLFRIDPRPFEASLRQSEAQALRDIASRDQAASQERRYQELLDKNFVSKEAYAQFRTNAATAEATSKASQAALENANLNIDYTVIRAPVNGYVGRALLQAGNMVKANDTISLVVINQVKPVYVGFAIPETQLQVVRNLMRKGGRRARLLHGWLEQPENFLWTILVGNTLAKSLTATAFGGFVGVIGFVAGQEATINVRQLLGPMVRVQGIAVGSRERFEAMLRAMTLHKLHPVIDSTFPLARTAEAFRKIERAEHIGKITISL